MAEERILIVEDEYVTMAALKVTVTNLGYTVVGTAAEEGEAVTKAGDLKPDLVLMDIRLRNGGSGIKAAEMIKEKLSIPVMYITAHSSTDTVDMAKITEPFGYILKPFTDKELAINISIALYKRDMEEKLKKANEKIKTLSGMLPICMTCKKIRDDKGYWSQIEHFIQKRSEAEFTHGICPDCAKKWVEKSHEA
ncbi:MAG: response regulator [Thermodesulfobacteriota bacterium]